MEKQKDDHQNGRGQTAEGTTIKKAVPQGENPTVKEGDSAQQRPVYGAEGGKNTSSREQQLPTIADGMAKGSHKDWNKNDS